MCFLHFTVLHKTTMCTDPINNLRQKIVMRLTYLNFKATVITCKYATVSANIIRTTRMHSSRMRTVRCSGRLRGDCPGVSAQGRCLPGGMSAWGVFA